MDANKQRRLLTETELFFIVESTEPELLAAEEKLGQMAAQIFDGIYEPGMFARLVKEGAFTGSTVAVGGKPVLVLIHTRNALGWLTIEGVATLGKSSVKMVFDAADAIARHLGAPVIQFVTRLRPLYRYGLDHDYKAAGVIMVKGVPA